VDTGTVAAQPGAASRNGAWRGSHRPCLRRALALPLLMLAAAGCLMWPAGTGPGAEPMPLAEAMDRRDRGEVVIVDVRSRSAFAAGHIPGAVGVPAEELTARLPEIRRLGRLPILYCG
jgi:hypothetical protein